MAPLLTKGKELNFLVDDNSNFTVNGNVFLSEVPPNITATPLPYAAVDPPISDGCFVGFDTPVPSSHHVIPFGKLKNIKFMSMFRFKAWWTSHSIGSKGSDLKPETQILILDKSNEAGGDSKRPYILLLPLIEGSFRASLQPGVDDYMDICVESGSTKVTESSFRSVFYIQAGDDPFTLVKDTIKVARTHLETFNLLEEKTLPGIIDRFGWCTRDAYVQPHGILQGVKGLVEGGCPPGLVLIDDGWQSICHDENQVDSEKMLCRLINFQENYKFKDYESPNESWSGPSKGMGAFIRDLKENFKSLDYVYAWHALCGYWGGLRPNVLGLPEAKVIKPKLTPGMKMTMEDLALDKIVNNGVGLVPPEMAEQLYEGLHSHLESVGIDGVKVDVIHLLEMLCEDYGGRVELARAYYDALTSSVKTHFKGNGVIASMEHGNDFMFLGTKAISLGLVGDDSHSKLLLQHIVHCAYNSLWIGNFIRPDWDMFQSTHPCAEIHAASRAISGGPIYVSDSVGEHNFPLLKSLVLPDGSILRCDNYALPTRDCLFEDPVHDKTMLKIWNLNKFTGVIGAFNCQETVSSKYAPENTHDVSSLIGPSDIEWKFAPNSISKGVKIFSLYFFHEKKVFVSMPSGHAKISLKPLNFELITISPVKTLANDLRFAPIGLVNMLNAGGAIQSLEYNATSVQIGVKGAGEMRVFASKTPVACLVNGANVTFVYEFYMVIVQVPWPNSSGISEIEYMFD
ncbi:hypothetical protein RD792_004278 [Penstemon davidsonii]|uniref:Galactinol--sucrose galactosyltransferase n=1 Tax=Penstemon davidsonii TaxID=160366 RepID=A0ABR0DGZ9_9LAMI|nr:hypothetical protein RD792_004278 [Penstemon davidsonii]